MRRRPPRNPYGFKKKRSFIAWSFLTLFTLAVAILSCAVTLLRSHPSHWRAYQAFITTNSLAEIEDIAHHAEYRLTAPFQTQAASTHTTAATTTHAQHTADASHQLQADAVNSDLVSANEPQTLATDVASAQTKSAPEGDQTVNEIYVVELTQREVHALAIARSERYMAQEGYTIPNEISHPLISFRDGQLVLSGEIKFNDLTQVLSGYFDLALDEAGMASASLVEFDAGKMPLPPREITGFLARNTPAEFADAYAQKANTALDKLERKKIDPVFEFQPGQYIKVLDYNITDEAVTLTLHAMDRQTYAQYRIKTPKMALRDSQAPPPTTLTKKPSGT